MAGLEPLHQLSAAPQTYAEILAWLNRCVGNKTQFCVYMNGTFKNLRHDFATPVLSSRTAIAVLCRELKKAGFEKVESFTVPTGGYRIILPREQVLKVIQATEAHEVDQLTKKPPAPPENSLSAYFDTNSGVTEVEEGVFAIASRPMPQNQAPQLIELLKQVDTEVAGITTIPQSDLVRVYVRVPDPTPAPLPQPAPAVRPMPPSQPAGGIEVRNGNIYIL